MEISNRARSGQTLSAHELARQLAHELSQPLANVVLLADLLLIGGKDVGQIAQKIIIHAQRAQEIANRARDHRNSPERKLINLHTLIGDILDMMIPPGIEKTVQFDDSIGMISLDPGQIEQVLVNLVRNALEAMRDGGRLTVITKQIDHAVQISVIDEGSGVSSAIADRLFEPFSTTKVQGIGVGLSISSDIVHAHGGTITVDKNYSNGACFVVSLPWESSGPP